MASKLSILLLGLAASCSKKKEEYSQPSISFPNFLVEKDFTKVHKKKRKKGKPYYTYHTNLS
jgi:hypothetical protein